jgi:hypothetical protein
MRWVPCAVLCAFLNSCGHTSAGVEGGIVNCLKLGSCAEPPGRNKVAWSDLHEALFKAGLEKLVNYELCRTAIGAPAASFYVAENAVRIASPQCNKLLTYGPDLHQAIDLLKTHKIFEIVEFKRLEAFSTHQGMMVGVIALYSYSLDPQSGEPRRDSFGQYLFIGHDRGVEVRWVATASS